MARVGTVLVLGSRRSLARQLDRAVGAFARVEHLSLRTAPSRRKWRGVAALVVDGVDSLAGESVEPIVRALERANRDARIFVVTDEASWIGTKLGRLASERVAYTSPAEAPELVASFLGRRGAPRDLVPQDWLDEWLADKGRAFAGRHGLTNAEGAVVVEAVRGSSNKEIARAVDRGVATVRTHLLSSCRKVGVASRGELGFAFFRDAMAGVAVRNQVAQVGRAVRPIVLAVSGDAALRAKLFAAIEARRRVEPLVLQPSSARFFLRLGIVFAACVIDCNSVLDEATWLGLFVPLVRSLHPETPIVLLGHSKTARSKAAGLGVAFLRTPPFRRDRFVALLRELVRTDEAKASTTHPIET